MKRSNQEHPSASFLRYSGCVSVVWRSFSHLPFDGATVWEGKNKFLSHASQTCRRLPGGVCSHAGLALRPQTSVLWRNVKAPALLAPPLSQQRRRVVVCYTAAVIPRHRVSAVALFLRLSGTSRVSGWRSSLLSRLVSSRCRRIKHRARESALYTLADDKQALFQTFFACCWMDRQRWLRWTYNVNK